MKKCRKKETIIINKDCLKDYKMISLGLENCENFNIDIADILDISFEAYRYTDSNKGLFSKNNCYLTSDGYIIISGRVKDMLSDFAYTEDCDYKPELYNEDDCKLYKRMTQCNDLCVFGLLDKSDRQKHFYVPYDALEDAVHRNEIDYANCPSFEILKNGDMEIRFGKLSKNPIIKRNNYHDLVEDWISVLGNFSPKALKLKVRNLAVEYSNGEESVVTLQCTILNKKRKNVKVIFKFYDCGKINIGNSKTIKTARAKMTKLCNGNIYFGIDNYFWLSCKSCKVLQP